MSLEIETGLEIEAPSHLKKHGFASVSTDVLNIAKRVKSEVDPNLSLKFSLPDGPYVVVYRSPLDGRERVVHVANDCDDRIIKELQLGDMQRNGLTYEQFEDNEARAELERERVQREFERELCKDVVLGMELAGMRPRSAVSMYVPGRHTSTGQRRLILPGEK